MCSSAKSLSQCCAFYSATGIIFTSWVGIMLMRQPFFVGGIEDYEKAKGSAFGAAGLFMFIFCVSIAHLIMDSMNVSNVVRSTVSAAHDDAYDGWTGQRTTSSGEYGQVPTNFEDFEDENNNGHTERVGFLS